VSILRFPLESIRLTVDSAPLSYRLRKNPRVARGCLAGDKVLLCPLPILVLSRCVGLHL